MNRKHILLIMIVFTIAVTLNLYNLGSGKTKLDKSIDNLTYSYQDTYVGDNSSVGGILYELPFGDYIESFSLGTRDKPYSITVNYVDGKIIEELNSIELAKVIEYNSTALFALVKNVDELVFNINNEAGMSYIKTRKEVQSNYTEELSEYIVSNDVWTSKVLREKLQSMELIESLYKLE